MSLVNDALNKIQKQRGQKLSMDELSRYGASPQPEIERKRGMPPAFWVGINATVLVAVLVGYHFFTTRSGTATAANSQLLSNESLPTPAAPRPTTVTATSRPRVTPPGSGETIANTTTNSTSPNGVVTPVPMTNSSSPSTPAANDNHSPDSDYDLAGMTSVGKNTLLSIVRRSDQRSFWVPIGKTVGEVTAVSYNADADNAVIQVRGQLITIGMRNGAVYFNPVSQQK